MEGHEVNKTRRDESVEPLGLDDVVKALSDRPSTCHVCKEKQQPLISCSSCGKYYHPGCHLPFFSSLVDASQWSCHKCTAQKPSLDLRYGMSRKQCSKCSKIFMTTSGSKHCKKCQERMKDEQILADVAGQKSASQSTRAKNPMHPLFRKNRRPQVRREKVGPAKTNSQRIVVDCSAGLELPVCKESSSASSFTNSKRNQDQAFLSIEVNRNDVHLNGGPQHKKRMSVVSLQNPRLTTSLGTSNVMLNDDRKEREKRDEDGGSKDELEKEMEDDELSQPSRIISRSLQYSESYRGQSQPYLDRSSPRIGDPLDSRKTIPRSILGVFPLTFEARNRANASEYDKSILDSYVYLGRIPLTGGNGHDKKTSLSNCARSAAVKHLVQDKEWYNRKQVEIQARGGRKGQWGKVITEEMFEERLAKGWNKHQNKPILEREQKNGDNLLRFFGFPENIQPVIYEDKLAMADSTLFKGGRTPARPELILGVNVWISQDK